MIGTSLPGGELKAAAVRRRGSINRRDSGRVCGGHRQAAKAHLWLRGAQHPAFKCSVMASVAAAETWYANVYVYGNSSQMGALKMLSVKKLLRRARRADERGSVDLPSTSPCRPWHRNRVNLACWRL